MRIAIIGRSEILYEAALLLSKHGHEIAIIITAKEAPEYTKTSVDFQLLAKDLGIPFIHTPRIEETIDAVNEIPSIDIGVSMNYTGVIPQSVIDLFPLGILNAHAGDLPRYRGNACQAWAILNGEERVGLCIHRMIGGELDSGDIIARDYFPLTVNTKVTEVWDWMNTRIPELFKCSVDNLAKDRGFVVESQSKNPKDALRCYPRRPEDGRVNWNCSAVEILHLINASNHPYAGAFCEFGQEKLVIWDACLVDDGENFLAVPGQVTWVGDEYIEVATGQGKLRLNEVELGREVAAPSRFIRSIRNRLS